MYIMYIALYSVRNKVKDWSLFSRQVALTNKSPLASLAILRYKKSPPPPPPGPLRKASYGSVINWSHKPNNLAQNRNRYIIFLNSICFDTFGKFRTSRIYIRDVLNFPNVSKQIEFRKMIYLFLFCAKYTSYIMPNKLAHFLKRIHIKKKTTIDSIYTTNNSLKALFNKKKKSL